MNKISVTIDLGKLDKTRIKERTYTNKDGKEVTVKEYQMDVVELKEKKTIKEGDTWRMVKSHFVSDSQSKEEREAKKESNFIGSGIIFENRDQAMEAVAEFNADEVPF